MWLSSFYRYIGVGAIGPIAAGRTARDRCMSYWAVVMPTTWSIDANASCYRPKGDNLALCISYLENIILLHD